MKFENQMYPEQVEFPDMPPQSFLLGLLSAFDNRYQAIADKCIREITWKQFFAIICINLCKESPTINELSDVMGCSHQNVKQILIKLEKKGFVSMIPDEKDKRKQRIMITKKCRDFFEKNDRVSQEFVMSIFAGIEEKELLTTIQTIMKMERNISAL